MSEFARYVLVQLLAYVLDMGGFLAVLWAFGPYPLTGNLLGKVLAGAFAFVAHSLFTFRRPQNLREPQNVARYGLLLALNIPMSSLLLSLIMLTGWPEPLCKFIADALGLALTFALSKKFVFIAEGGSSFGRTTP